MNSFLKSCERGGCHPESEQCFHCSLLDTRMQGEHSFVKASSVGVKATAKNAKKNLVE